MTNARVKNVNCEAYNANNRWLLKTGQNEVMLSNSEYVDHIHSLLFCGVRRRVIMNE